MLYAMLSRNGDTVQTIRELIAVPPKVEAALWLYASRHPEDRAGIEGALSYRRAVGEEFEWLVRESSARHLTFGESGT